MRRFGLIGYPLGHSFSKKYFTEKFNREKITDCSYENYPLISLDAFPDLISTNPELCGLNVTIPYKTEILDYIDVISPEIRDIGAVNVLKIKRMDCKTVIWGYNSDVYGIRESMMPYISGNVKSALIFGTGGASKAVQYTLEKIGIRVTLVSRTEKPGTLTYRQLRSGIIHNTDILINTTPVGMYPDTDSAPDIDYPVLNKNHILFDLVYNPEITLFLKKGQEQGCKIITGIKMLHSQAERSWAIWNDQDL